MLRFVSFKRIDFFISEAGRLSPRFIVKNGLLSKLPTMKDDSGNSMQLIIKSLSGFSLPAIAVVSNIRERKIVILIFTFNQPP
jgi:hypothetical protein